MKDYRDFGIEIPYGRTSGNVKTYCPQCRDSRHNKHDKSLSVDLDKGVWNCHYCGWASGLGQSDDEKKQWMQQQPWFNPRPLKREKPVYKKPQHTGNATMSSKAIAWFAGRKISQKTLEQMRVTEGLEWMPQKEGQANTIQFNYYHNGELVNTKFRTGDKCFKMCTGAELLPYNIDNIKGTKECIITEGEMDALSFVECGRTDVISVPNGANANLSYLDDYIEVYFDDKDTIFIASDTDTKGVILRDELLRRFGAERCRILEYGEGCKDANEHLMKFGRDSLLQCLANAPEVKVEGIFTVSDFEQSLDAIFEHGLQKGVTIGHDNFDKLCSFETKRLCIVTGIPGCLAGDTLVSMADGTQKPIKDIQVGDMVVSYTKDYQRVTKEVVTKWISGKKEVLQLNLRNGMSVQPTPKHKFLSFDGWKPAGEIKEGDFLLVAPTAEGAEDSISPDMLKLLAIWMADGNKNTSSYIVTKKSGRIVSELYDICKRNNVRIKRKSDTGETIISTRKPLVMPRDRYIQSISYAFRKQKGYGEDASREAAEKMYEERKAEGVSRFNPVDELKRLGVWGLKTETLKVPDEVFRQTNENVALFLNYLFACDGWVTDKTVGYCSNSKRLCLDIQSLLLRFEVYMPVREKRVKYKGKTRIAYSMETASEPDIIRLIERVGVLGKADRYKPKGAKCHSDFVLSELNNAPAYFCKHGIKVHHDNSKPRMSRDNAIACARLDGNELLLNKLNCRWEEVRSIDSIGVVDTYDLEVQDTHNYLASNVLLSNSGKSEFIDEIAECLNMRYGWRFAYFSPENAPLAYHASKLIEKFTGKKFSKESLKYGEYKQVKEHLETNFYFISPADNFRVDTILEKAKFLVRRKGIKALVIDPYNRLESQQGNRNETQYISELLDKLTNFAQINDILVVLMAHPTKQPKNRDGIIEAPTLYDISGSANFYNKADFGIVVHRNRLENYVEVHVQKVKFRHLGEVGMCKFKYNLNNGRYTPYNGEMTINWDNTNHLQEHERQAEQEAYERSTFDFRDNDMPDDDCPF